jgi:hypothetical protein
MTDEQLVKSFLDKNYSLKASFVRYYVVEKQSDKEFSEKSFNDEISNIFGHINGLKNYFEEWFDNKKVELLKEIYDEFALLDFKKRSVQLIGGLSELELSKKYDRPFIVQIFEDYYFNYVLKYKLKNFIKETYEDKKTCSSDLIRLASPILTEETPTIIEKAEAMINEWYFENVFSKKIELFFKEAKLVLGPTNWMVIHPYYGKLNTDKLSKHFPEETIYQTSVLNKQYDDWYNEKILEVSEKMMKEF